MEKAALSALALLLILAPAMSRSQPPHVSADKAHSPRHAGEPNFPLIVAPARPKAFRAGDSPFLEFPVPAGLTLRHQPSRKSPAADASGSPGTSGFEPVVPMAWIAPAARPARMAEPIPECK